MNALDSSARRSEWLDSPARRVNPLSKPHTNLPPEFESGNGYDWCDSCGVHFRTEALKRHKKTDVHRANVVQYAEWIASLKAKEAERGNSSQPPLPSLESVLQPAAVDERTSTTAMEAADPQLSNPNPEFDKSVTRVLSDGDNRKHLRELEINSEKSTWSLFKSIVPDTLPAEEREERENTLHAFCTFDRSATLETLGVNAAKPSDQVFIRNDHDNTWMFGTSAKSRVIGKAVLEKYRKAQLLLTAPGPVPAARKSRSAHRSPRK
ncbi:hypothetical protein H9P43_008799 [Blastocladiella emersonii ATCC 22665]|nr:hypothetical protein H9P43_008799 [Blastocladiella emersonii ATCC 22665]